MGLEKKALQWKQQKANYRYFWNASNGGSKQIGGRCNWIFRILFDFDIIVCIKQSKFLGLTVICFFFPIVSWNVSNCPVLQAVTWDGLFPQLYFRLLLCIFTLWLFAPPSDATPPIYVNFKGRDSHSNLSWISLHQISKLSKICRFPLGVLNGF